MNQNPLLCGKRKHPAIGHFLSKPVRKMAFGIQLIKLDQRACENFKYLTYVSEVKCVTIFFF